MKQEILDLGFENLKIYQAPDGYCFTSDSVLLANYIKCHKTDKVAEFCAGSGVISILLSKKQNPEKIYAFELQKRPCDMFSKSVKLNNLENQIQSINAKLEDCLNFLSRASLDVVFCNPPYMESGDHSDNPEIALATHEIETNLRFRGKQTRFREPSLQSPRRRRTQHHDSHPCRHQGFRNSALHHRRLAEGVRRPQGKEIRGQRQRCDRA